MKTKAAKPIRRGDLIRTMWKAPGKSTGKCLQCGEWAPVKGIAAYNVSRQALKHTRRTGHRTRVAYIEVIEYRMRDHE